MYFLTVFLALILALMVAGVVFIAFHTIQLGRYQEESRTYLAELAHVHSQETNRIIREGQEILDRIDARHKDTQILIRMLLERTDKKSDGAA